MHAFFATVPFTILEAVSYVIQNDIEDADLYLSCVFKDARETGERIRESGVFKNVFIVENVLLTYPITIKKCFEVMRNRRKIISDMSGRVYDYAYYNNSGFLVNSIFYTGVCRANKSAKHFFLEHAHYSYLNRYSDKPWYLKPMIRLFGLKCMDGSQLDKVYLYEPDLSTVKQDAPVEQLKKIDISNVRLKEKLNFIFNYSPEHDEFKEKKIIIMEQGKLKVDFDKEAFWAEVFKCINKDISIVKPHPRQKDSTLKHLGAEICKNTTLPWEIICLNNNLSDKVQITIFSQACISPKLIFDQEPTVIFLYKLLPVGYDYLGQGLLEFADSIGNLYKDKTKYFIPESFDELREYCIKHNIGQ